MPDVETKPRTRGKGKLTIAVKDAVERAFNKVNHDGQYLVRLADEHPQVFCGLVSKCIPTAVAIDVKHHIDLGNAMLEASQRLKDFNAQTIEHTPNTIQLTPIVDITNEDDQPISVIPNTKELSD